MKIYLKRLTDDLLEVCRMIDGEAKTRLAEITFDVSLLPDVGYGIDKEIEIPAERLAILE
jgi:hypothetical protein